MRTLAQQHDCLLLDLDGTVFRGHAPTPGAVETLASVECRALFVTNNASRSADEVAAHLCELGFTAVNDDVVTSAPSPERIDVQSSAQHRLQTDRQLLGIVLSNLVENACKYSAKNSAIEIAVEDLGSQVQVTFKNSPGRAGWPAHGDSRRDANAPADSDDRFGGRKPARGVTGRHCPTTPCPRALRACRVAWVHRFVWL